MWKKITKKLPEKTSVKTAIYSGLNISLILLVLNLLSLNFDILEKSFVHAFAAFLIISVLLLNIPLKKLCVTIRKKTAEFNRIIAGLILLIISFIVFLFTKNQMLWIASIPLLISGLDLTIRGIDSKRKELYLLSVTSFVYAIFFMLLQTIPALWYAIQQFSLIVSGAVGFLVNKSLSLGPSTSGLWIVIIFLIFSIVSFFLSYTKKKSNIIRLILIRLGLFIVWIIYMIILAFVEFESKQDVVNLHIILFLLCLIPTFLYLIRYEFKDSKIIRLKFKKIRAKNGAILALIFLFISSLTPTVLMNNTTSSEDHNIMFYGQNMLGTWDIPEYGKYGREASGMFGLLPVYLNASGYDCDIIVDNVTTFLNTSQPVHENITRYVNLTDHMSIIESSVITSDILNEVDVFVVTSINRSFTENEKNTIWEFVEKGGSLFVLGDHTNVGGIQDPLNDLLEPVDISYRFDSALPIDQKFRWMTSYQLLHHPITFQLDDLDQIQISVGASLDITPSSFPVVVGRYALSDMGDRTNEELAYLGDYEYNAGEQLGDVILVAGSYYGKGKVLIFGDTSTFQNSAIPNSISFIQNIFTWLVSNQNSSLNIIQITVSVMFLIAALLVYILLKGTTISFTFFPLILVITLLISVGINSLLIKETEITGNTVYIDASHGERFNLEPFTDNSVNGLILNLNRNGYFPIILRDFSEDKIAGSKILFFNAPTKSFSGDKVDFLKQYMYNGGFIVLSTGYEDKAASMPLLEEFDLDIKDVPLGPVPYVEENPEEYENEPRFVDGWPIDFEIGKSYYNFTWNIDYHLMVFVEHGQGGLLLISDSEYLLDKNIESIYDYWPGNIIFLKHLIDEFKSMGGQ